MDSNKKILISGAGGVTGRAIIRSLRESVKYRNSRIIGTDIFENLYGLHNKYTDILYKVPKSSDPKYRSSFESIVDKERPDAIIISTELEALFWSDKELDNSKLPSFEITSFLASKGSLYEHLANTDLIPKSMVLSEKDFNSLLDIKETDFKNQDIWIRSFDLGSTSAKGASKISTRSDFDTWKGLNPETKEILVSELLPGRNFAHNLLIDNGEIIANAIYERLEYFGAKNIPSGISGNISKGKIINPEYLLPFSRRLVNFTNSIYGNENFNGLITIDYKEDFNKLPKITEVNLRHTAATHAFALAGINMAELQVDHILGNPININHPEIPEDNMFFRDIDGIPWYTEDINELMAHIIN